MYNLHSEISKVQQEYLQLLQKSVNNISEVNPIGIIDNILVFWHSHRRTILLFLNSLEQEDKAYLFTGASYLKVKDNNHYPLISLGKIHIIDDSLCKLAKSFPALAINKAHDFYFEHINHTISDTIEILDKYNDHIIILPVTFGFHDDDTKINKASIKNFFYLFKEEFTTIDEYFSKVETIDDIYAALKDECKNSLPMTDVASIEEGFISGFNEFKKTLPGQSIKNNSDALLFFMHIHGLLTQAVDILLCCVRFDLVPYIRSQTCFYYTSTAATNFFEIPFVKEINFYMTAAYILYKSFPEELTLIKFEEYQKAISDCNIFENRLNPLLSSYLEKSQLSFREIQEELQACFEQLTETFKNTTRLDRG